MGETSSKRDRGPDDETIGRLVEAAGSRPPEADDKMARDLAAMRQEVQESWQTEQSERHQGSGRFSRHPVLRMVAAALVLVAAGWLAVRLFSTAPEPGTPEIVLASVESVSGAVTISGIGIEAGETVLSRSEVVTASGRIALRLESGESLRLDRGTEAVLLARDRVRLVRGAAYVDAAAGAGSLVLETPFGEARDLGTQYSIEVGPDRVTVRVREGVVALEQARSSVMVAAGEQVQANRGGEVDRRPLDPSGAVWEWILDVAMPFEIDGASVAEYLTWLRRETGWQIRYGSEKARQAAATTVLQGSIAGIDPRQTPEVALLSAGLRHRLVGSVLVVESGGDER